MILLPNFLTITHLNKNEWRTNDVILSMVHEVGSLKVLVAEGDARLTFDYCNGEIVNLKLWNSYGNDYGYWRYEKLLDCLPKQKFRRIK